jgi:dipeptidyl aminopeptidase/acylaminoacyl peptidase
VAPRRIRRGGLALSVVALTLGSADLSQAAFPGDNGRIAFAVEKWRLPDPCRRDVPHGCEPELYASTIETVLPSGRGRRVLRAFPAEEPAVAPAWSPTGRSLAFEQGSRLGIVRRDGTGARRLPSLTSGDHSPTWSPNGRRLAFTGSSVCCNWLYTVRTDGRDLRRVVAQEALDAVWSVTGTLAFANVTGRRPEYSRLEAGLYTVRPDRTRLRRLARYGGQPDWSPDGARIAFSGGREILKARADGRRRQRLTTGASERTRSTAPAWSPDGRYIAFLRDGDLYLMRSTGRNLRRVVDAPQPDPDNPERAWTVLSAPTWQPLPH